MKTRTRLSLIFIAAALFFVLRGPESTFAASYAGLVIRHGDGSVVTRCIAFEESSISGIELLFRSGLSIETGSSGYGNCVYRLDGEGTQDDWSSGRAYWSYWHLRDGWTLSPVGASSYSVKNGYVEGWSWGSQTNSIPPPVITFEELYADAYGSPTTTDGSQQANNAGGSTTTENTTTAASTNGQSTTGTSRQSDSTVANTATTGTGTASKTAGKDRGKSSKENGNSFIALLREYWAFLLITTGLLSTAGYLLVRNHKRKIGP